MEGLKKSIRYQFIETKKFLLGFWIVIILVNIGFYILNSTLTDRVNIGFSIGMTEGISAISIAGINLMGILIGLIVYNYESNYEDFPLAISLSMTRKEYFASFLVNNVFIAFVCGIIQGILLKIDPYFVKMAGKNPLNDFKYFNTASDNIFYIMFILFIVFLAFSAFCNLLASINYKIGYKMWLIIVAANIALSILNIDFFWRIFRTIENILSPRLHITQILIILASIAILYVINYFVVMRTDIKKKLG